jgi:hypothetical protein
MSISFSASACSIGGLQYEVKYSDGSTSLSAQEARKLAEWFIDLRDGIGINYAYVFTSSITGDSQTHAISVSRRENIQRLLKVLNKKDSEIKFGDSKLKNTSKDMWPYWLSVVNVEIQPLCAKTRSCCGGNYR